MSTMTAAQFTLYTYAPSPNTTHPDLPVLDPAALYAASLLRRRNVTFVVRAPSTWLHKSLPRLERTVTADSPPIVVAEGLRAIEQYVAALPPAAGVQDDTDEGADVSLLALEAHLASAIEPLVYTVLFPPSITSSTPSSSSQHGSLTSGAGSSAILKPVFDTVTFPAYSKGLSFPSSRTTPHRLRENISASVFSEPASPLAKLLTSPHIPSSEAGLTDEEREERREKERVREQMRSFSGSGSGGSRILRFGRGQKQEWTAEFARQRLALAAREVLKPVVVHLKNAAARAQAGDEVSLSPTLLHLFALLAPLVLFGSQQSRGVEQNSGDQAASPSVSRGIAALRSHPVVQVLRGGADTHGQNDLEAGSSHGDMSYLTQWVERVWQTVWATDAERIRTRGETAASGAAPPAWEQTILGPVDAAPLDPAASGDEASQRTAPSTATSWSSYIASFVPFVGSSSRRDSGHRPTGHGAGKNRSDSEGQGPTELERKAERRLRIGRAIWVGTALLGTVGWLFLSGVVQVDFSGEEDEEEEEIYVLDDEVSEEQGGILGDYGGDEEKGAQEAAEADEQSKPLRFTTRTDQWEDDQSEASQSG